MKDATAEKMIRMAIRRATVQGRDLVEYLDQYGWLATPSRLDEAELSAIDGLIARFEHASVAELVGGGYASGNWSANDFLLGVLRLLRQERDKIQPNGR